jgi:putative protease
VVERHGKVWRVFPNEPMHTLEGLRVGLVISRNRDHAWEQALTKKSAERRIGVSATFAETAEGFSLTLQDEDGIAVTASAAFDKQAAKNPSEAEASVREQLARFGNTDFELRSPASVPSPACGITNDLAGVVGQPSQMASSFTRGLGRGHPVETLHPLPHPSPTSVGGELCHPAGESITIHWTQPWFVPSSLANKLRRDAVEQLEAARLKACTHPVRKTAVEPPAQYPEDTLSFLANVYNSAARDFYAKHGVKLIAAAYEAHEEAGEVPLMITRHCIRFSLSLCPRQAKGVIGVQGQVRAEPMTLINGSEKLRLEFDCRKCEMHVMGKMKKHVLKSPSPTA